MNNIKIDSSPNNRNNDNHNNNYNNGNNDNSNDNKNNSKLSYVMIKSNDTVNGDKNEIQN